jgi:hypothetical protein
MEPSPIGWKVESDSLGQMIRVDSDLDKDIQSLYLSGIDRHLFSEELRDEIIDRQKSLQT